MTMAPTLATNKGMAWLWALAIATLYLLGLNEPALFDVDEGAFAEASREMLASADWWHTTLNGLDRFDKPIGVYWLQALSLAIWGNHEFAVRLPSALAVGWALFQVGQFVQLRWGSRVGHATALMLATCLGLLAIGRASTADGLLNALLIVTHLKLWQFIEHGSRRDLWWVYFLTALGILVKGPIAVIVPGATLALWSFSTDRGHTLLRALKDPVGWMLLLATAAPWYVYALNRHGMAFIEGFILKHNVERFTGTLEGHGGSLLYYLLVLPMLLLPWSPLVWNVLRNIRSHWTDPLQRYLTIWFAFVWAFFSLSGTKLPHYMLYGVAPLVMLMSWHLQKTSTLLRALLLVCLLLQTCLGLFLPNLAAQFTHHISDTWYQHLFATAGPSLPVWAYGWGLMLVFWILLTAVALRKTRSDDSFTVHVLGSGWAVSMLWVIATVPWIGNALQDPFKDVALWAKQQQLSLVQWRMHQPSLGFYLEQPTPQRMPLPSEHVVVKLGREEGLAGQYQLVYEYRGLKVLKRLTEPVQ